MVCEMRVNAEGKVTRSDFFAGVMRSKARLTYSQVNELLEGRAKNSVPRSLHTPIRELHALYKVFAKARGRRGANMAPTVAIGRG